MNDFLKMLPPAPVAFHEMQSKKQFRSMIGTIIPDSGRFIKNTGGADNDSRRGFGSTTQVYNFMTEKGWTIRADGYDGGRYRIFCAWDPNGVWWDEHFIHYDTWYCQDGVPATVVETFKKQSLARDAFFREWYRNTIPCKIAGWSVRGWYAYDEKGVLQFEVTNYSDVLSRDEKQTSPIEWWHEGMTIQELF